MSDNTKIEWADATVNAINGCSVISPGCKHCYAMKQAHRFDARRGLTHKTSGGMVWTGEVRLNEKALLDPLKWKRPRRIFWNAHGDTFHENVPDDWIDRVLAVCALTPQHTHMILTKRSARMRQYMTSPVTPERIARVILENYQAWGVPALPRVIDALANRKSEEQPSIAAMPIRSVWLGVSVEDQTRADERIPDLLATPAAIRFISAEPLLGPVDLTRVRPATSTWLNALEGSEHIGPAVVKAEKIDWVIAGGESGPGARPMHPDWARSLRDQCAAAGVLFHFKQWGDWGFTTAVGNSTGGVDFVPPPSMGINMMRWRKWEGEHARSLRNGESVGEWFTPAVYSVPVGKKAAGRLLDGVTHDGWPA